MKLDLLKCCGASQQIQPKLNEIQWYPIKDFGFMRTIIETTTTCPPAGGNPLKGDFQSPLQSLFR
ncbi:MAG: hypothetical protein NWS46_08245 [Cyclobacteriaceae bacterium]|nr:hypothetical protein [Cyclobacteriaceae bacterium]